MELLKRASRPLIRSLVPLSIFAFLLINISHAPRAVQKLLPEGPSTCHTSVHFQCGNVIPDFPSEAAQGQARVENGWSFNPDVDSRNYGLTLEQCEATFSGLFTDVNESMKRRRGNQITIEELDRIGPLKASIRAMIYDQELYIIRYTRPTVRASRHMATLHALHRAILASPSPIPSVEFVLTVDDFARPEDLMWSYTRKPHANNTWLMPDFSFWSWAESNSAMGSYSHIRRRILEVEDEMNSFEEKIPKIFWRGNVGIAPRLRQDLMDRTEGQSWADTHALDWGDKQNLAEHLVPVEDHCKYMFLVHTEGNSYSGRLKYLQNCHSLIFAHDMQWIQPFEYLMVSDGPKQNYVSVQRDFSDLKKKVLYYLEHKNEAKRIATNSVETFRNRYLTPAAEACYWRKLINAWSEVSFSPDLFEQASDGRRVLRGIPFEDYALMQRADFLRSG